MPHSSHYSLKYHVSSYRALDLCHPVFILNAVFFLHHNIVVVVAINHGLLVLVLVLLLVLLPALLPNGRAA